MAKHTRYSFSSGSIKSCKPFDVLHIDVWRPYKNNTYSGHNLFLNIVDDYIRVKWTHLMKFKSDSVHLMSQFLTYVGTQLSTKVLAIRSDNAPYLCEGDMKLFSYTKTS